MKKPLYNVPLPNSLYSRGHPIMHLTPKKTLTTSTLALKTTARPTTQLHNEPTLLPFKNRNKVNHQRLLARSIQHLPAYNNKQSIQNQETSSTSQDCLPLTDDQLFRDSNLKIQQLRQIIPSRSLDLELKELLQTIKQEKCKINETINGLKKGIQHYKAMYKMKSHEKLVRDWSGNTEEIVINGQIESNLVECEVQTEVSEEKDKGKCEQENKESQLVKNVEKRQQNSANNLRQKQPKQVADSSAAEVYGKLVSMLVSMKIDPRDILPPEATVGLQITQRKALSDQQIIKVQKFLLKKLVEKIHK